MEFLVEFELNVPDRPREPRVRNRELAEAFANYEWMRVSVVPLEPHPNDPAAA